MYPLLGINPLVAYDVATYGRLIKSQGGELGDGIVSEQEAFARLTNFVTGLYASAGRRCDFWPLMEAYQLGFGSKCYSFHGLEGTLVNGPVWGRDGIKFNQSASQYIDTSIGLLQLPATHISVCNPSGSYPTIWGSASVNVNLYMDTQAASSHSRFVFSWNGLNNLISDDGFAGKFTMVAIASGSAGADYTMGINGVTVANNGPIGQGVGNLRIGGRNAAYMHGTIALHLHDKSRFSQTQIAAVYAAYKTTLGKDLVLP